MDSSTRDIPIEERLREVYDKTDSREYAEALDSLENARQTDPGNIYISALKRQLEELLSLSQADDLSEDRRHELMDPMQGIIECAVRDNHRQRTGATAAPHEAAPRPEADTHGAESADAQKELEALKLLYFQRASKFVMKGEYEQALAEVRRVFVVDPQNTIAREYASRVEQLIQHARRLAAEPVDAPQPEPEAPAPPAVEPEPPAAAPARAERATAWDDDFAAPRQAAPLPERRSAPPSSRQTMAYGDRLAVSLADTRGDDDGDEHAPRKKSRLFLVLATVILTPLLAGVGIAIFSAKNGASASDNVRAQVPVQNVNATTSAAATIGASVGPAPAQAAAVEHTTPSISAPAKPAPEQKPERTAAAVETAPRTVTTQGAAAQQAPPVTPPAPQPSAPQQKPLIAEATASPAASAPHTTPPAVTPAQPAPQAPPTPFVAVEKEPQIVHLVTPDFPSFVWRMGGEGQVVIRVLIDANGKPLDSQILKSTNAVFEQPVVDAVMKSQFNPAQMGQGPVAAWLTIPFKFRQPR